VWRKVHRSFKCDMRELMDKLRKDGQDHKALALSHNAGRNIDFRWLRLESD